jgi:hypothetical protein
MIINYSEKKCFHKISELNTVLGDRTDTKPLFFLDSLDRKRGSIIFVNLWHHLSKTMAAGAWELIVDNSPIPYISPNAEPARRGDPGLTED